MIIANRCSKVSATFGPELDHIKTRPFTYHIDAAIELLIVRASSVRAVGVQLLMRIRQPSSCDLTRDTKGFVIISDVISENFIKMPPIYILNTLVHLVNLVAYSYTLYYAFNELHIPVLENKFSKFNPSHLKFLTTWNVILQAIFFLICLLNDLFGTNAINPKKPPFMRKLKDYFHASLGFPIAMFVGVTFWALMFVDRELVLPKALDLYFPWWLNHLMHTMIMVTTVLEMIVAPRQYPKRSHSLGILATFMLMYLIWIHVIYYKSGVWVYPIMDVLTQTLRVVFFAMLLTFCTILYFVGETLNNIIWGNEYTKHKKSHAKSK